jgi:hypothetical protein
VQADFYQAVVGEFIMHFPMLNLVNATVSDVKARRINRRNRRGDRTWGVAKDAEVGDRLLPRLRPWIHIARLEWLSGEQKTGLELSRNVWIRERNFPSFCMHVTSPKPLADFN